MNKSDLQVGGEQKIHRLKKIQQFLSEVIPPLIAKIIPGFIDDQKVASYQHGWEVGHGSGYKKGYVIGTSEGKVSGETSGRDAGEAIGYEKGFEAGKGVWVIDDRIPLGKPKAIDLSVYGPEQFYVSESLKEKMRVEVAAAVAKRLVDEPTPAQWDMIFAANPATCIFAGAGSGKSTTLVLRVIFMLVHLNVLIDHMTVVSFTRASCKELRESLERVFPHWGIRATPKRIESLVRTFHSALHRVAKVTFPNVEFFENVGRKNKQVISLPVDGVEDEDDSGDLENAFAAIKLNRVQLELVKEAYIDTFNESEKFRRCVAKMLEIECARDVVGGEADKDHRLSIIALASGRDQQLVELVNSRLKEKGLWPSWLVDVGPIKVFDAGGHPFYANAKLSDSGLPVFMGGFGGQDSLFGSKEMLGEGGEAFGVINCLKVKKDIFTKYMGGRSIYVNGRQALKRLEWRNSYMSSPANEALKVAPIFDVRLDGEVSPSAIYEALYTQACFIENMGKHVSKAVSTMAAFRGEVLEYFFCAALPIFWKRFNENLKFMKYMTFNQAFLLLAEGKIESGKWPDTGLLAPFRHMLIDEFQDISPQIVSWLVKCQRSIAVLEEKGVPVSVMAIGDDWQSIYGWRGSAPDFFIKFDTHFISHKKIGKAEKMLMKENFRSIGDVVRDGEIILGPVKNKTRKDSAVTKEAEVTDHGVRVYECENYSEESLRKIAGAILQQYKFACSLQKSHKNKVIVMSRSNGVIDKLEEILGDIPGVVYYTYHRAKGLQGEVAVMVEDCFYENNHKLRNRIYESTGLFERGYDYDAAQYDEAMRLAYVGVTRGRRRVLWFVDEVKNGSASSVLLQAKGQSANLMQ